jgi:uncharacterized membrane protein YfcA
MATAALATGLHLGSGGSAGARAAALLIVGMAGIAAGMINAVVGSGSLFTFPTLLALGVPPIAANVSNNIGLVPGNVAAAWGYRRELAGQRRRTTTLVPASLLGAVVGAIALLTLPASAFADVVPVLIAIAVVLVFVQPRIQARLRRRTAEGGEPATAVDGDRVSPLLIGGVFLAGVYGGYFGAAQGVLLIGLLGSLVVETLQRLNGVKNVLALVVNATAAVLFAVFASAQIRWSVVLVIAIGSTIGGVLGARVGRRLSPTVLRVVIAVVGVAAIVKLLA